MGVRNLGKTIAISIAALLATAILCAAAFVQFQQHLLRWRADRPEQDNINNGDYTLIPYTDQALAAVQRGIARDKLADVP